MSDAKTSSAAADEAYAQLRDSESTPSELRRFLAAAEALPPESAVKLLAVALVSHVLRDAPAGHPDRRTGFEAGSVLRAFEEQGVCLSARGDAAARPADLERLESVQRALIRDRERTENSVKDLRAEVRALAGQVSELAARCAPEEVPRTELEPERSQSEATIRELRAQVAELILQAIESRRQRLDALDRLGAETRERVDAQAAAKALHQEVESIRAERDRALDEASAARSVRAEAEQQRADSAAECDRLRGELRQSQAAVEELRARLDRIARALVEQQGRALERERISDHPTMERCSNVE